MAGIWSKILKVDRVGRSDNFFELGGHSLLAVRLVAEIEKLTKVRLPLAVLLQAPTVAGLAAVLHQENWKPSWSSLVAIKPGGSKSPLFLMHAHGGDVLEYYPLANLLGSDRPVYALQARGLNGVFAKDTKLADMAAAYVAELRSLQPQRPYFLGGFCFGGLLALEVAQQLTAEGQEVELLAMIRSVHPDAWQFKPGTTVFQRTWYRAAKRIGLELDNLSHRKSSYLVDRLRYVSGVIRARMSIAIDRLTGREHQELSKLPLQYILEILGEVHEKALEGWMPRRTKGAWSCSGPASSSAVWSPTNASAGSRFSTANSKSSKFPAISKTFCWSRMSAALQRNLMKSSRNLICMNSQRVPARTIFPPPHLYVSQFDTRL